MSQIKIDYEGSSYTLEYTRRSIQQMEAQGFEAEKLSSKPMTMLPMLFRGAFLAHHKYLRADLIDKIYDHIGNKEAMIEALSEMYVEPYKTLLGEVEDDSEGNAVWTKV